MKIKYLLSLCFVLATSGSLCVARAQNDSLQNNISASGLRSELEQLKGQVAFLKLNIEQKNNALRNEISGYASIGLILFLFGSFCALWAQDTGRHFWSWFFFGFFFSVLAVITMLIRNGEDNRLDR